MPPRTKKPKITSSTELDIEECLLPNEEMVSLREKLLAWYDVNRRKLPWRGDPPPYNSSLLESIPASLSAASTHRVSAYGTWVSEVMLQQTRVDTVIDYYTKWMTKFPNLEVLANASKDEVNSSWAGLGYYRRAACLHEGAKKCVDELNGELPLTAQGLQKDIKGIGPYTAGAVASIAYSEPVPCVDGNVIRVFSRVHHIDSKLGQTPCRTPAQLTPICWQLAEHLLDRNRPGDYNQALMELGATICTPRAPKCLQCPLHSHCKGYRAMTSGDLADVSLYPAKAVKKPPTEHVFLVCAVSHGNKTQKAWLMIQRPSTGLLANQWEFPSVEVRPVMVQAPSVELLERPRVELKLEAEGEEMIESYPTESWKVAAEQMLSMLESLNIQGGNIPQGIQVMKVLEPQLVKQRAPSAPVVHVFSHQRHEMHVVCANIATTKPGTLDIKQASTRKAKWMSEGDMEGVGITTGAKKVLERAKSKQYWSGIVT